MSASYTMLESAEEYANEWTLQEIFRERPEEYDGWDSMERIHGATLWSALHLHRRTPND